MKPRLGTINLDWLDYEITANRHLLIETPQEDIVHYSLYKGWLATLEMVKSHCTPIEENFTFVDGSIKINSESILQISGRINEEYSGLLYKEPFLSKTCINDWESNAYCSNEGKCELCKIKQ